MSALVKVRAVAPRNHAGIRVSCGSGGLPKKIWSDKRDMPCLIHKGPTCLFFSNIDFCAGNILESGTPGTIIGIRL